MSGVTPTGSMDGPPPLQEDDKKSPADKKTEAVSTNFFQQAGHVGFVALKGFGKPFVLVGSFLYHLFDYLFHGKKLPLLVNPPPKDAFFEAQKNGEKVISELGTKMELCRRKNQGMFFNPIARKSGEAITSSDTVARYTFSPQAELGFEKSFTAGGIKTKIWGICEGHDDNKKKKSLVQSAHHFVVSRLPLLVEEKLTILARKKKSLNEKNFSSFMQGVMQQLSHEMKQNFKSAPPGSASFATLAGVIEIGDHVFLFSLGDTSICEVSRNTGLVVYLLTPANQDALEKKFKPTQAPFSAIGARMDNEGKLHQDPLLLSLNYMPKEALSHFDLVVHSRGFDMGATGQFFYNEMGRWIKEHANDPALKKAQSLANGAINNFAPSCTVMVGKY